MAKYGGKYGRGEPLIAVRMPPDEIARVRAAAALQNTNVSELIRRLLRAHLAEAGVTDERAGAAYRWQCWQRSLA